MSETMMRTDFTSRISSTIFYLKTQSNLRSMHMDLTTYFRDIARVPLLNAEDEQSLGKKSEKGCLLSRQKLILSNLRLIVYIAKGYTSDSYLLSEAIGAGNLGLVHAAEKYRVAHGTRFASYAQLWIRQCIKTASWQKTGW